MTQTTSLAAAQARIIELEAQADSHALTVAYIAGRHDGWNNAIDAAEKECIRLHNDNTEKLQHLYDRGFAQACQLSADAVRALKKGPKP